MKAIKNPTDEVINAIRKERIRQITHEGYEPDHDDEHRSGQLADAAACYAAGRPIFERVEAKRKNHPHMIRFSELWPWGDDEDKRLDSPDPPRRRVNKGRIKELTKAAALIVAEIERLERRRAGGLS